MTFYCSTLFALVALLCSVVFCSSDSFQKLASICDQENKQLIHFSDFHQVTELIELFPNQSDVCPVKFLGSFEALGLLLASDNLNDICSPSTYLYLRGFHLRFVSNYAPDVDEQLESSSKSKPEELDPIPESLRRFFVLFALQINKQCKLEMLRRLPEMTETLNQEFQELEESVKVGSKLMNIKSDSRQMKMNEVKLESVKKNREDDYEDQLEQWKLFVQLDAQTGKPLKSAKHLCEAKFIDIYSRLISPVIRLNNLGYSDSLLAELEELFETDKSYNRWYRIMEVCEILKHLEIVELELVDGQLRNEPKSELKRIQITILTPEEAESYEQPAGEKRADGESEKVTFDAHLWAAEESTRDSKLINFDLRLESRADERRTFADLEPKQSLGLREELRKRNVDLLNSDRSDSLEGFVRFLARHKASPELISQIIGMMISTELLS